MNVYKLRFKKLKNNKQNRYTTGYNFYFLLDRPESPYDL